MKFAVISRYANKYTVKGMCAFSRYLEAATMRSKKGRTN